MAKLKDIAAAAGVSISTVSKALNNSNEIKKDTKVRIERIARELNYNIKSQNVGLTLRGDHTIGVICPEIDSNYYTQLISSIGNQITRKGFKYTIAVTDFKQEKEEQSLELFSHQAVDGIVFITENDNMQRTVSSIQAIWNTPIVIIASENDVNNFDCIRIDDNLGVETGVEYLVRLGHRSIAYIGDSLTSNRLKVFRTAMSKQQVPVNESLIHTPTTRFEACGYRSMRDILAGKTVPTAVFAAYDDIAIGAMKAIYENGLSIPNDISVIGIDNVAVSPYLHKSLTTISNPIKEMAIVSISILSRKIADKDFVVIQNVVLKPTLIIRETTQKPKS